LAKTIVVNVALLKIRRLKMRMLSTQEIAMDLGLNIRSVQRYINEGFLPAIQVAKSINKVSYEIDYSEYNSWKNKHFRGIKRGMINKTQRLDREPSFKETQELALKWLESLKLGTFNGKVYSLMTVESYDFQMKKFFKMIKKSKTSRLSDILNYDSISRILSEISVDKFASRQKLFDALWCFLKYLLDHSLISESEVLRIKKLKPKRFIPAKRITFSENQIQQILDSNQESKGNGDYDKLLTESIVITLANTGLRVNELVSLKLKDVDLENRVLYVWLGKGNKNRRIGLNQVTLDALTKYLAVRQGLAQNEFFFLNRHEERLRPNALRHKWQRLSKKLGFPITNHGFRRSFVTINNRKGRSLVDLQIACAHSDISMTRSYCMTTEDEVVDAMKGW
jgi:site-specific recombinase XerD